MAETIINRVAKSPLVTLALEDYYQPGERVLLDLKTILFQGMILREKDFRNWAKEHNWEQYKNKHLAVTCTTEAIIPVWAYMLVATKASEHCYTLIQGNLVDLETTLFSNAIDKIDFEIYRDKMVVVKGCSKIAIPESAYLEVTMKLVEVAKSIMYGEPCSTVPVYKRPKQNIAK